MSSWRPVGTLVQIERAVFDPQRRKAPSIRAAIRRALQQMRYRTEYVQHALAHGYDMEYMLEHYLSLTASLDGRPIAEVLAGLADNRDANLVALIRATPPADLDAILRRVLTKLIK